MNQAKKMHHLEIGLKNPNQVLATKKVTLRDRLLNAIFGNGQEMIILLPGKSVETISVTEMEVHKSKPHA